MVKFRKIALWSFLKSFTSEQVAADRDQLPIVK